MATGAARNNVTSQEPVEPDRPLAGRTALITGAGRGIGRAIALRLAADGADVCVAARTRTEVEQTARDAEATGGRAVALTCDLADSDGAQLLVQQAAEQLGGLTILVNNAGGAHRLTPLEYLEADAFELGTRLNYTSVYATMRAAAPYLFASQAPSAVLNIVSVAAARGFRHMSYYSGAKAGVVGLTRSVAREWGPHGVRVNCLGPGWIATGLSRPLLEDQDFAQRTLPEIPLGRWGLPEDVADVAAFLLSDAARYVTGTTVYVDGGLLA